MHLKRGLHRLLKLITTGLIQEDGGHQELPGVVEKCFLYKVVWRAGRRPLFERLPPGWAEVCVHMVDMSP